MTLCARNYRQKVEVNAVIEAVALVPTETVYRVLKFFGFPFVTLGFGITERAAKFAHSDKFALHKTVEKYRAAALRRSVKVAGVVVNALRAVVEPEIEAAGVLALGLIIRNELFDLLKMRFYPVVTLADRVADKQNVLREHRLVRVALRRCGGMYLFGRYEDRQSAVFLTVHEKVEDTAALVLRNVLVDVVIYEHLTERNVGEPAVPVPKRRLVRGASRHDVRVFEKPLGLAEHSLVMRYHVVVYNFAFFVHYYTACVIFLQADYIPKS